MRLYFGTTYNDVLFIDDTDIYTAGYVCGNVVNPILFGSSLGEE